MELMETSASAVLVVVPVLPLRKVDSTAYPRDRQDWNERSRKDIVTKVVKSMHPVRA